MPSLRGVKWPSEFRQNESTHSARPGCWTPSANMSAYNFATDDVGTAYVMNRPADKATAARGFGGKQS